MSHPRNAAILTLSYLLVCLWSGAACAGRRTTVKKEVSVNVFIHSCKESGPPRCAGVVVGSNSTESPTWAVFYPKGALDEHGRIALPSYEYTKMWEGLMARGERFRFPFEMTEYSSSSGSGVLRVLVFLPLPGVFAILMAPGSAFTFDISPPGGLGYAETVYSLASSLRTPSGMCLGDWWPIDFASGGFSSAVWDAGGRSTRGKYIEGQLPVRIEHLVLSPAPCAGSQGTVPQD